MKKLVIAAFALTAAVSVIAQGTVLFLNNATGVASSRIWAPSSTNPSLSLTGNSPADLPAGTTDYLGAGMLRVGAVGATLGGPTTFAQLFGANGAGALESSLLPASGGGITTFRTGGAAGVMAQIDSTLAGVPIDAPVATLQVRAWDNSSGLYATWAAALPAWEAGLIAAGMGPLFQVSAIGGGNNTPANAVTPSFNLYFNVIPEPSTFALAGLGAAALMIFRRRK